MELSHKNSSRNENIPPRVIPGGISTVSQNCPHVPFFFFTSLEMHKTLLFLLKTVNNLSDVPFLEKL